MKRSYSFFPFGGNLVTVAAALVISFTASAAQYPPDPATLRLAAKSARVWMDYVAINNALTGEQMVYAHDILFARALHITEWRINSIIASEGETPDDAIIFPQIIWVRALPDDELGPVFAALGEMGGGATAGYRPGYKVDLSNPERLGESIQNVVAHGERSELIVLDPFNVGSESNVPAFIKAVDGGLKFERAVIVVDRSNLYSRLGQAVKEQVSLVGDDVCARYLSDPDEYRK